MLDCTLQDSYSILITDDDDGCRNSLAEVFRQEGYHTYLAECGEQALEIARRELIHLLIMDMYMPGMSGLETLELIRRLCERFLPCVFVSADTTVRKRLRSRDEACPIVPKPVDAARIRSVVRRVIKTYY